MGRLAEIYRCIPTWQALVISVIVAGTLALVAGIGGGIAGICLYDRGMSKGNDLAVGLIGLNATGMVAFVTVFSWLRKLHREISWCTPVFTFLCCLSVSTLTTLLFGNTSDTYYMGFIFAGWVVTLLCGLAAALLSGYLFIGDKA